MENVNIEATVLETIQRFKSDHGEEAPLVFVSSSPQVPDVVSADDRLREFVRLFVYECLRGHAAKQLLEVLLARVNDLGDLNEILETRPSSWVQLRLSGRALKHDERSIEGLFRGLGYRCQGWKAVTGSALRWAIFGTRFAPRKVIVGLDSAQGTKKCDLLIPVWQQVAKQRMVGTLASRRELNRKSITT